MTVIPTFLLLLIHNVNARSEPIKPNIVFVVADDLVRVSLLTYFNLFAAI